MTPGLLNFSNEIISHIGDFLHQDHDIPIPSFHPHWAGFKHDIVSHVQKDFLSFRSTCTRTRNAIQLRDLHVTISKWSDVLRWNMECSKQVRQAVKRMIIDIPKNVGPEIYANDHEHRLQEKYHIGGIWSTMTHFLFEFTALEELVIVNIPLCNHGEGPHNLGPDSLNLPSYDFLPALKPLAFECKCYKCSIELPRLFIPAASNIRHLKLVHTYQEQFSLPTMAEEWMALRKKSEGLEDNGIGGNLPSLPMETLMVEFLDRSCPRVSTAIEILQPHCPNLNSLYISMYPENDDAPYSGMCLGAKPLDHAASRSDSGSDWIYTILENDDATAEDHLSELEMNRDWTTDTFWQDFLISLSGMKKLKTLECLTCVHVPLVDGKMFVPESNTRGSTYEYQLNGLKERSMSNYTPNGQPRMAMTGAAQAMIDHCPSLEKGYFWQWLEQDNRHGSPGPEAENNGRDDEPNWKRWTWSASPTLSSKKAVIEPWVEEFSVKWTYSTDGEEGRPEDDD
ncbi:hypothetical protein I203_103379 [Kwoniella mangroviensis CBS 8507]|uniref:uncharacterized protein n=1 Tax=Kwoniella mangroviensis CBS 8507 TaxID=1296122 RepID=UPI00080CF4C0|nr:uncharacterized protein I203_06086 [Kwoniella mangroviensis CBS 8507]OCF64842.1 hypothetical protein I203_06086 [Kwoniella mangroviensis CBS 8507]